MLTEHDLTWVWGMILSLVAVLLVAVLIGIRLYHKAGADIRAANAQERIAAVLERRCK